MSTRCIAAACALLGFASLAPAQAQQPDMAAMQKWMSAKTANWHIVGRYEGDPAISSDGQGLAHVSDVVELDVRLAWQGGNEIVGKPAIKNGPSIVSKPHDREPKCLAPVLKGEFDYATLESATPGLAGALHLKLTRTYSDVVVSKVCTSTTLAPAKKTSEEAELFIPQPTFLAMGMSDKTMSVTPDKKSIVMTNPSGFNGWVWTLTPTPG